MGHRSVLVVSHSLVLSSVLSHCSPTFLFSTFEEQSTIIGLSIVILSISFPNFGLLYNSILLAKEMGVDDGNRFCRRCTKCAYDEFAVNIQAADELIKNLAYLVEEEHILQGTEILDLASAVLRVVEEATSYILVHRLSNPNPEARNVDGRYIHADSLLFEEDSMEIPGWLHDTPVHILGISMKQLCEKIAPEGGRLQVLHCEKVMRKDFRSNFFESQEELRESLSRLSLSHLSQAVYHLVVSVKPSSKNIAVAMAKMPKKN